MRYGASQSSDKYRHRSRKGSLLQGNDQRVVHNEVVTRLALSMVSDVQVKVKKGGSVGTTLKRAMSGAILPGFDSVGTERLNFELVSGRAFPTPTP